MRQGAHQGAAVEGLKLQADARPPESGKGGVMNVARRANGQFRKGASGNPGGRPAGLQRVSELAREHTEAALAVLVEIAHSPKAPASARVAAASALLDRGWGKPPQATEHSGQVDLTPSVKVVLNEDSSESSTAA